MRRETISLLIALTAAYRHSPSSAASTSICAAVCLVEGDEFGSFLQSLNPIQPVRIKSRTVACRANSLDLPSAQRRSVLLQTQLASYRTLLRLLVIV
jgi:hypothetical protein